MHPQLLLLTTIFVVCLAAAITAYRYEFRDLNDTNDSEFRKCVSECAHYSKLEIIYDRCHDECSQKIHSFLKRAKRSMDIFNIPTMPPFPSFDAVTPFSQQSLGEALYNQTSEKSGHSKFNKNTAYEQFEPDANAEVFHPTCIQKFQNQYPQVDFSRCKQEVCDVPQQLRVQILDCSKEHVTLKGYVRTYNHTDDKTTGKEFNQNAGFKKMLTETGEQTNVFNATTGSKVHSKYNSTVQHAKDIILNSKENKGVY